MRGNRVPDKTTKTFVDNDAFVQSTDIQKSSHDQHTSLVLRFASASQRGRQWPFLIDRKKAVAVVQNFKALARYP